MAEQTYIQILDSVNYSRIIVLHRADTLVFVLYNTVHLNNNNIIYLISVILELKVWAST